MEAATFVLPRVRASVCAMQDIAAIVDEVGFPEEYDFRNCETRLNKFGPYNRTDVLFAAVVTLGTLADMAELLGRRRGSLKEYISAHPEVREFIEDIREGAIDKIETEEIKSALAGDPTSRRFILTTLGKNRGFSTRTEQTGKDGGPIDHTDPISRIFAKIAEGGKRIVDITPEKSDGS